MYEKALETLNLADQYLRDPVIYDHIGDVYYKMNQIEDAIKYWELSLQLLPQQDEVIKKINAIKSDQARRSAQ